MHNETWENRDSDFNNTTNSFSINGGDAYERSADRENDDDDIDEEFEIDDVNDDPNEIPEQEETDNEGEGYHTQAEVDQPERSADTSYSEQIDVTPPNKHEFPSEGPAKTDFASRPHGRTTGRMVGHEPGTEGI